MNRLGRTALGTAVTLTGLAAAAGVLQARERSAPLPPPGDRLLYLRSGATASRLFLSFDALAADVYWMRAVQHYGRDRKSSRTSGRFEQLQPLLDVTTTLDPRFNIAYRFGAIFLSLEPPDGPGRIDQAIALLEKGLAANPWRWQYAHDIGFIHYWYTGNYGEAAHWFERASAIEGAPDWIGPLAAVTLAQGGDREGARHLLRELLNADEGYIRASAERSLAQLDALDRLDALQPVVEAFHARTGRYPAAWRDVEREGLLRGTPVDPTGVPFVLESATPRVAVAPESTLQPMPRAFGRR